MLQVTLRQLEYAVAVADHRHFGRAAEASGVSQPGLSAQIRELERRLGVRLFERGGRHVLLTEAGRDIVERSRDVLRGAAELQVAAAAHHGSLRGAVRIASIPTMAPYLLPTLVHTLRSLWPDADLVLQELRTAELVRAVEHGELDLGLLATPVDTGGLRVRELAHEPFVLALPVGHPLAIPEPAPVRVLRDLPVLLLEEGHCLHHHARAACEIAGPTDRTVVRSASLSTLAQMVASGIGVTLLPVSTVELEARPGTDVVARPFAPPVPGRTISLVWRETDSREVFFGPAAGVLGDALESLLAAAG